MSDLTPEERIILALHREGVHTDPYWARYDGSECEPLPDSPFADFVFFAASAVTMAAAAILAPVVVVVGFAAGAIRAVLKGDQA